MQNMQFNDYTEYNLWLGINLCRDPRIKLQTSRYLQNGLKLCRSAVFHDFEAYPIKIIFHVDVGTDVFRLYVEEWPSLLFLW